MRIFENLSITAWTGNEAEISSPIEEFLDTTTLPFGFGLSRNWTVESREIPLSGCEAVGGRLETWRLENEWRMSRDGVATLTSLGLSRRHCQVTPN